jgi:hypothetical protein
MFFQNNADVRLESSSLDPPHEAARPVAAPCPPGRQMRSGGRRNTEDWQLVFQQMAAMPTVIKESQLL